MDETQKKALQTWYAAYVDRFEPHPHLQMKLAHSERVARDAAEIARELAWPEDEVRTAGILGLLHDIGRFSQFAQFGTFSDRRSVDHGRRGFEILTRESPLATCRERDRARILEGVRHHNAKTLPEGMADDSSRFARLVRDADRLDLYELVHSAVARQDGGFMAGLDREAPPSEHVLECLRLRRMVSSDAVRGLADYLLLQVGWVFDTGCVVTMKRLRERRVLENLRENLRKHLAADAAVAEILALAADFRDEVLTGASGLAR